MKMSVDGESKCSTQYESCQAKKRSLFRTAFNAAGRCLVTFGIIMCLFTVLHFYSERLPIMTSRTERELNTIVTGLSIALSLSNAMGFSGVISPLRWWILSRRHFSPRRIDCIVQADSLKAAIGLAMRTRKYSIQAAAVMWLVLMAMCQVALAVLGLCYSVNRVDEYALIVFPGDVSIPRMSGVDTIKAVQANSTSIAAQEFTANNYGQMSIAYVTGTLDSRPEPGRLWNPADPLMFCGDKYCQYLFHEKTPRYWDTVTVDPLTVFTSRRINSSSTCKSWIVSDGGDGSQDKITLATDIGPRDVRILLRGGFDQTTFMTDTSLSCGSGCRSISAFEASLVSPWYYECNVTVSEVENAEISEHHVGADLRTMAAAGIALQGYAMSSFANNTSLQYRSYPAESTFGLPIQGDNISMEMLLARFAIGVVAVTAENNNPVIVSGYTPERGSHLEVDNWGYASAILIFLAGIQLSLEVVAIVLGHQIVVPPSDVVAVAQILRAVKTQNCALHDANDKGCEDCLKTKRWIYRSRQATEAGVYDLYMESE